MPQGTRTKKWLNQLITRAYLQTNEKKAATKERRRTSNDQLTFHFQTYNEWFDQHEDIRYDIGSEQWMKLCLQTIDFLVNPNNTKKNDDIIMHFAKEQLKEMGNDPELF